MKKLKNLLYIIPICLGLSLPLFVSNEVKSVSAYTNIINSDLNSSTLGSFEIQVDTTDSENYMYIDGLDFYYDFNYINISPLNYNNSENFGYLQFVNPVDNMTYYLYDNNYEIEAIYENDYNDSYIQLTFNGLAYNNLTGLFETPSIKYFIEDCDVDVDFDIGLICSLVMSFSVINNSSFNVNALNEYLDLYSQNFEEITFLDYSNSFNGVYLGFVTGFYNNNLFVNGVSNSDYSDLSESYDILSDSYSDLSESYDILSDSYSDLEGDYNNLYNDFESYKYDIETAIEDLINVYQYENYNLDVNHRIPIDSFYINTFGMNKFDNSTYYINSPVIVNGEAKSFIIFRLYGDSNNLSVVSASNEVSINSILSNNNILLSMSYTSDIFNKTISLRILDSNTNSILVNLLEYLDVSYTSVSDLDKDSLINALSDYNNVLSVNNELSTINSNLTNLVSNLQQQADNLESIGALTNTFGLIKTSFVSLVPLMEIELLPNITIGMLITIPFVIAIVSLLFRMLS